MALVEDQHHILVEHVDDFILLLEQDTQFLNRGDDDAAIRVVQLLLQDFIIAVAVGAILLEIVILLHGLVVQIFAVHHKEDFLHTFHFTGQLCRLERCQGLAATRRVPDVSPTLDGALQFVEHGHVDAL